MYRSRIFGCQFPLLHFFELEQNSMQHCYLLSDPIYYYIIIHVFIMHTHSVVILNQRCWQSLGGQHVKGDDGLYEKVSFQTAFEGVKSW